MTKAARSWAFYDWANSAFSTTVMALYFPIFFKEFYSKGIDSGESTFYLGLANSSAALFIGLCAPILGAIADVGHYKKRLVVFFVIWGAVMTACLSLVGQGNYLLAAGVYALASYCHAMSLSPYDSLLMDVAEKDQWDSISAWGYSLGYLGGGLLVLINNAMVLFPEFFSLKDASQGVRVSFFTVGLWWLVWSLPFCFHVKEKHRAKSGSSVKENIRIGLRTLVSTVKNLLGYKNVLIFLIAFFIYNDGVGTVIKMAVDFGKAIQIENKHLIASLTLVQFVAFPLTLLFGKIAQRLSPKTAIYIGLGVYSVVVVWAFQMRAVWEFYALAVLIGFAQGGVQCVSRSLYARLIPADKSGEFFGFYNLMGKFTGLIGPLMVGIIAKSTGNPRVGILSILSLFVLGAIVLMKVKTEHLEVEEEHG